MIPDHNSRGEGAPPPKTEHRIDWSDAWLDVVAFGGGLALAWFGHWETKDLVWSLWLSSLLVGYAMIVWSIFGPGIQVAWQAWAERDQLRDTAAGNLAGGAVMLVGGLFLLAFFTVHFGMFHFVHSVFLNSFFPMQPGTKGWPGPALYWAVLSAYWPFVLVAAVAERQAFRWPRADEAAAADTSVKAADVNRRLAAGRNGFGGMMAPYRNVVRLHLLIFFFAFAHFAKLDGFLVYAVVYAVYFFPWRLIRKA
ncbi:MAG TPA: DUF6498-containing protein [Lacunisphaera sp.]|nr:DUF6498-containing protein [Lacunisphaera sp.]